MKKYIVILHLFALCQIALSQNIVFNQEHSRLRLPNDIIDSICFKQDSTDIYMNILDGIKINGVPYDVSINNQWRGKKIVWLGTSVPFGMKATKSYVKEAADKLGFNLVPAFVPGLAIHANYDSDTGLLYALNYGSTVLSKQENINAINAGLHGITIPDAPLPWTPGGVYNNYYRCYENVFTQENADADLWVFDVVPNNSNWSLDDWNAFNKNDFVYSDSSSFASHRTTFIGALLFLMRQMYDLNPKARCVFILGSAFRYTEGKTALELLSAQWHIPIIDMWGKVNTSKPSLSYIYSEYPGIEKEDGSMGSTIDQHPSSFGHQIMGNILTNELLLIN